MTGPDRITSVLQAYSLGARTGFIAQRAVGQAGDSVQISSEGRQKSEEFRSQLRKEASPPQESDSQSSASQNSVSQLRSGDNLQIFNLPSNAGFDQIHSAYLAAIKQYHPDNFSGYSPEFQKLAEEKSKQIISTYQKLMKNRQD
jgi:DnaJ-domain-containing protein 1